jgi:hypothetical protein
VECWIWEGFIEQVPRACPIPSSSPIPLPESGQNPLAISNDDNPDGSQQETICRIEGRGAFHRARSRRCSALTGSHETWTRRRPGIPLQVRPWTSLCYSAAPPVHNQSVPPQHLELAPGLTRIVSDCRRGPAGHLGRLLGRGNQPTQLPHTVCRPPGRDRHA